MWVCYDDLGVEARRGTKPEPSMTTEENTGTKKVDPVKEEKPLKQGTKLTKQD